MGSPAMGIDVGPPDAGSRYIGVQREIRLAAPAAGAAALATVEGGTWQRVALARALFTASAAVANRIPEFVIQDPDGLTLWEGLTSAAVVANGVLTLYAAAGAPAIAAAAQSIGAVAFPAIWLPAGYRYGFAAQAIDAADQFSAVRFVVEEIDRGPLGEQIGTDTQSAF